MDWNGKKVTLYSEWDPGGDAFLVAPNKRHGEFTLEAVPNTNPLLYSVTYDPGYMNDCWSKCGYLSEMGSIDPPTVKPFPELTDTDPNLNDECHRALLKFIETVETDSTSYRRLEGTMPVVYGGKHFIDRVRMFWLKGVVPVSGGYPCEDLIVVLLKAISGGLAENGGASGPPR